MKIQKKEKERGYPANFILYEAQRKKLKKMAKENGVSESEVVRQAINNI